MLGPDAHMTPAFLELRFQRRRNTNHCVTVVRTVVGIQAAARDTQEKHLNPAPNARASSSEKGHLSRKMQNEETFARPIDGVEEETHPEHDPFGLEL